MKISDLVHSSHRCHVCAKTLGRKSDLNRHMRIHNPADRPHSCGFCDKKFIQRSALTVHLRTHTGERPYPCDSCDKAFADSSSLARHRRTHDADAQDIPCPVSGCSKSFHRQTTLDKHVARDHPQLVPPTLASSPPKLRRRVRSASLVDSPCPSPAPTLTDRSENASDIQSQVDAKMSLDIGATPFEDALQTDPLPSSPAPARADVHLQPPQSPIGPTFELPRPFARPAALSFAARTHSFSDTTLARTPTPLSRTFAQGLPSASWLSPRGLRHPWSPTSPSNWALTPLSSS